MIRQLTQLVAFLCGISTNCFSSCNFLNNTSSMDIRPIQAVNAVIHFEITYQRNESDRTGYYFIWKLNRESISQLRLYINGTLESISNSNRSSLKWDATSENSLIWMKLELQNLQVNDKIVEVGSFNSGAIFIYQSLNVTYCPVLSSKNPRLEINVSVNSSFEDTATYNCVNSSVMVEEILLDEISDTYVRNCQEDATWDRKGNISCSYAPNPQILVKSLSSTSPENHQYYVNDSLILQCNDTGYPSSSIKYILILYNGSTVQIQSDTLPLEPEYDEGDLLCNARNAYTEKFGHPDGINSSSVTIRVLFPPQPLSTSSEPENPFIGENCTLIYSFSANPYVDESELTLKFKSEHDDTYDISDNATLRNYSGGSQYKMIQTCTYFIPNVTVESFGVYNLVAYSSEFSDPLNMSISLPNTVISTTIAGPPPPPTIGLPAIIGISVAGLFVIILIVGYVGFRWKRNKTNTKSAEMKEEKENPIYGTSAGGVSVEYAAVNKSGHASSSKEERLNPLYDTNSGAQGGVEEAYAAVDVNKKKKKNKANKGNENAAFTTESNAAVYAAVDKSKKKKNDKPPVEAVYSEVNKKKGSKNDTALHGSSQ